MTIKTDWEPEGYIDTAPEYFWKLMFHEGERALLRPQRAGRRWIWYRDIRGGIAWTQDGITVYNTRAEAALAANKPRSYADTVDRISPEERVF